MLTYCTHKSAILHGICTLKIKSSKIKCVEDEIVKFILMQMFFEIYKIKEELL